MSSETSIDSHDPVRLPPSPPGGFGAPGPPDPAADALQPWQLFTLAGLIGATIVGTVKSKAGQPLAGLALVEKGEIHNNVWDRGALVDAQGRFRIEVASGGQYGLHVYASGYIYAPQAVRVESGKTLELSVVLIPAPTRANDPTIKGAGFFPWEARQGKVSFVKLEVGDPNDDLGPQVMAFNAATGQAYAMQPPRRVRKRCT